VTVTDGNSCSSYPDTTLVSVTSALVANAGPDKTICSGQSTTIGLPAGGGVAPYTYAWSASPACASPGCLSDPAAQSPTVSPTQTTVFSELVTDQANSSSASSVTVTVIPNPGTAGANKLLDPGASVVIGPPPVSGASYAWSCNRPDCALSSTTIAQPVASPVQSTTYTLSATNGPACASTTSMTIWVGLGFTSAPADGALAYPVNAKLLVQFSQPILPSSLNTSTVRLNDVLSGAAIPITLAYDPSTRTLIVTPGSGYASNTEYTLTLVGGAAGIASDDPILPNLLLSDQLIDYTTGNADTAAPVLTFRSPGVGLTNVPTNAEVVATFDEAVLPTSVNRTTVTLSAGGVPVAGTLTYNATNRTLTLRPSADLSAFTTYTVSIVGVTDLAGNATNITWTFTTGAARDLTPPSVTAVTPANGTTAVVSSTAVTVTFSEAVAQATLTSGFVLRSVATGTTVAGAVTFNPVTNVATFTPNTLLDGLTEYEVVVSGVADLSGNVMPTPFTSRFTTRLTLFLDRFEEGLDNWLTPLSNTGVAWDLSTATSISPSHSFTDSPAGKYGSNVLSTASLASPIPVTGLSSVTLQLSVKARTVRNRDFFFVDYRVNGGAWTQLNRPGTNNGWTGNLAWATYTLPITMPANAATFELRLRLQNTSNTNRVSDGVYVDDILLQSP
jgi:hypothetical protein